MSPLSGGLNRFSEDARRDQTIDALNVVAEERFIRRRDAFVPVGSAPPHMMPAGNISVRTSADNVSFSADDRTPTFGSQSFIYVGSLALPSGFFCGVDIRELSATLAPVEHLVCVPQFWNGSDWQDMPSWVDETRDLVDGYFVPLARPGRIYWHLNQIVETWTERSVGVFSARTALWVRLCIRDLDGEAATIPSTTHEVTAPGIRIFTFAPVNGLFPTNVQNRPTLIIGSDRVERLVTEEGIVDDDQGDAFAVAASGLEQGAQLGAKTENAGDTRILHLLEDEGPGVYGEQAWPFPTKNGSPIYSGKALRLDEYSEVDAPTTPISGVVDMGHIALDGVAQAFIILDIKQDVWGGTLGSQAFLFGAYRTIDWAGAGARGGGAWFQVWSNTDGSLFIEVSGGAIQWSSATGVFADDTVYNIAIAFDLGNATPANRIKVWLDKVPLTPLSMTFGFAYPVFEDWTSTPTAPGSFLLGGKGTNGSVAEGVEYDALGIWIGTGSVPSTGDVEDLHDDGLRASALGDPDHELLFDDEDVTDTGDTPFTPYYVNGETYVDLLRSGGSPNTFGTADRLQKTRTEVYDAATYRYVPYAWETSKWRGGRLSLDMAPVATFAANTVRTAVADSLKAVSGWYRHARIRCTARSGNGPAVGEEREVYDHVVAGDVHTFHVYPDWSDIPDGNNTFVLYGPPAVCKFAYQRPVYEVYDNDEHTVQLVDEPLAPSPAGISPTNPLLWFLGRELRWTTPAGQRWSGVTDPVTGNFICTNGRSPLLEFDGQNIRRLRADFQGPQALLIAGQTEDARSNPQAEPRALALSTLRRAPPEGRFVASFKSRLVVAGYERVRLAWSEPGINNNVWPLANEDLIRDSEQDAITGLISFEDRLLITTPTSLHELVEISVAPYLATVQVARGIGFVSGDAVCTIVGRGGVSQIVGCAPDGLKGYSSGEPIDILDDYARVIPNGVNVDALHRAVAVCAPQRSAALFAVPGRGSRRNNYVIYWDYFRRTFSLWDAPFGISSMAVDYDSAGRERILFGTDDGYIMTLGGGTTDDGTAITSYAVSPFVGMGDGTEVALVSLLLYARTIGATASQRMEVDILLDDNLDQPVQEELLTVHKGGDVLPDWELDADRFQKKDFMSIRMNVIAEARARRFAYKVGGSVPWALKSAEMTVVPLSKHGARR